MLTHCRQYIVDEALEKKNEVLDVSDWTLNNLVVSLLYIIYIYIYIVIFIWWSPFIPSRNLDKVFTYNHIWL